AWIDGRCLQIPRHNRDAMPADARRWVVRPEGKGLGLGGLDYFVHINTKSIAQQRHFVDEADVDEPERILYKLGQFRDIRRANWHDFVDTCFVKSAAEARRFGRRP